jgi:transaldolase/glucose-6-phosphate isomerase
MASLPQWLEQLIAESTGKEGKGLIPVVASPAITRSPSPGAPSHVPPGTSVDIFKASDLPLGTDIFFVDISLKAYSARQHDDMLREIEARGHPIIRITLDEKIDLGAEMFCWEIAVATACAVTGVQPFNQPDVELSKLLARQTMAKSEVNRGVGESDAISGERSELLAADDSDVLTERLDGLLSGAGPGDYVCLQAYLEPGPAVSVLLEEIRLLVLRRTGLAIIAGYGPRFLHSTGQLHKGGPNTGIFIQLVDEPANDIAIPETEHTFGDLIRAQSLGDFQALVGRGRRVLRINLGADARGGLRALAASLR